MRSLCALAAFALVASCRPARARGQTSDAAPTQTSGSGANRAFFGQDLFISKGQSIENATCIFCSVQAEGDVSGRVLVLFGNLSVTGRVSGNVTVLGGNAVLDQQARITGRTAVLFGNLVYETEDVLTGSAYVLGGHATSYGAQRSLRRRFSLSPKLLSMLVVLSFALLAALGLAGRRRAYRS